MSPEAYVSWLTLSSGGIRGIVQLTILEILEERIGLDIPIQEFFNLIVGTRYEHLNRKNSFPPYVQRLMQEQ
jgi:patatin-like phospholipase/acyl hydrolase